MKIRQLIPNSDSDEEGWIQDPEGGLALPQHKQG